MNFETKIIDIKNLTIKSDLHSSVLIESLSLSVYQNEILTLLGESGSGKTTLALALMELLSKNLYQEGSIEYTGFPSKRVRGRDIAMVFQDPQVSFNPFFSIGFQLDEVLSTHLVIKKRDYKSYLLPRLEEVGLPSPSRLLKAKPNQLSGGEKQRVLIAMALLCDPHLLIADEPTASLDFILRVEILKLLQNLKKKRAFSMLLITHDLLSALKVSDRIAVLKKGQLVELGSVEQFKNKQVTEYTQNILNSRILMKVESRL
ncbi:MAG: Oligopeptide transport ATP-binding protein OppD [Chlamydiae bacterium]|nr:Oligopeptide transport ATP-binding protein OppD [Chlamydiota bacterium]